jgi:hypothetical protein
LPKTKAPLLYTVFQ